jgi:RNA polymerase sigma-70 factor (ECF subfamily)
MYFVEDLELARRVAAGEPQALAQLLDRFYGPVFRFLWHCSGSKEDAEDLASQALLRARTDIRSYRGNGPLAAWMYKVARSELLRYRRRQALALVFASKSREEVVAPHNEDFVVVQSALAMVPIHQRTAFLLIEVEGLTIEEAAKSLSVPPGTVKSRCFHAKKRLRVILGPAYPEVSNHVQPVVD